MLTVLYTVGFDYFDVAIVHANRETHLIYTVTGLDLFKNTWIPLSEFGGFVKTFFNTLKKAVRLIG